MGDDGGCTHDDRPGPEGETFGCIAGGEGVQMYERDKAMAMGAPWAAGCIAGGEGVQMYERDKAMAMGAPWAAGSSSRRSGRGKDEHDRPAWRLLKGFVGLAISVGLSASPVSASGSGGAGAEEAVQARGVDAGGRRVALVVGNDAYDSVRPLQNAVNDARAVARALEEVGFGVTTVENAKRNQLGSAMTEFLEDVSRSDVALFYFAGHGVQLGQEIYALSTDHGGVSEAEVRLNELGVLGVARELGEQAGLALLVVDACRNNPFRNRLGSLPREMAMEPPSNTWIAYAAAEGEAAADGQPGDNGLFTAEFVNALRIRDVEGVELFRNVATRVHEASNGRQRPVLRHDLLTRFVFHPTGIASGVFRDCVDCPEMVTVPAGRFPGGGAADDEERGQVDVGSFALSTYEVTFDEYERFVDVARGGRGRPSDAGWGRGSRPVINVSWEDAAAYAEWLTEVTGRAYRLPSELEWEYAARAGTTTRYSWGGDVGRGRANCADCGYEEGGRTAPVGRFTANAWGLHDTAGNVWEWVADCRREEESRDGRGNGGGGCAVRVARGGSWLNGAGSIGPRARTAARGGRRHRGYGFRVARSAEADGGNGGPQRP